MSPLTVDMQQEEVIHAQAPTEIKRQAKLSMQGSTAPHGRIRQPGSIVVATQA